MYNLWLVTFYLQRYLKRQSVHCSKFCLSQLFTRICDLGTLLQTILTSKKLTNFILIQIEVTGTLKLLRSIQVFHKTVKQYLSTSTTYTKIRLSRCNFKRLKVLTYRLNKIWSLDLADMQSIASKYLGFRYLLAVDTLSRFLRVESIRNKNAVTTKQAYFTNDSINGTRACLERRW